MVAGDYNHLIGQVFGRLTIKAVYRGRLGSEKRTRACVSCICECGQTKEAVVFDLLRGKILSCGCFKIERAIEVNTTHGHRYEKIWGIWNSMKQRCNNPKDPNYKNYGGRGIKVCDKWQSFSGFYEDVGDPPFKKTLDRINNDSGYSPDNCRWITQREQCNNRRTNIMLTLNGNSKTISGWANEYGIKYMALWHQIRRRSLSLEEALPILLRKKGKYNDKY